MRVKNRAKPYIRIIGTAVVIVACVVLLVLFSGRLDSGTVEKQSDILKNAITRATATCYAVEGRYPENLQYLIDHYGVVVDSDTFIVSYEVFADNLMPDIRVIEKGDIR